MANALIIYHSKTGTTKKFGFAIRDYLQTLGIESKAIPIQNLVDGDINQHDMILLGCWTSGLFLIMQHPEKELVKFSRKLPDLGNKKIGLFTTYKLLTGSMFANMKKFLKPNSLTILCFVNTVGKCEIIVDCVLLIIFSCNFSQTRGTPMNIVGLASRNVRTRDVLRASLSANQTVPRQQIGI